MIGRATIGRPWIFKEIKHYLTTGEHLENIPFHEKMNIIRQQVKDSVERIDEYRGILHIRRHLAATPIFKGIPNFRETRIEMLRADNVEHLFSVLDRIEKDFSEYLK